MSQKPEVASKDEQIPPLLAAHSLQGARELHCPYTRPKVAPHVVGIQGQGVRAVQWECRGAFRCGGSWQSNNLCRRTGL